MPPLTGGSLVVLGAIGTSTILPNAPINVAAGAQLDYYGAAGVSTFNNNVTLNLGVRWDRNHGVDSAGNLVANDSITSPRVGIVWDPKGDGMWTVSASASRSEPSMNSWLDSTGTGGC